MSENLRLQVEDFLFREAELLDNWQLDEWLQLFTDDARYVVPATDLPEGDHTKDLCIISDNMLMLRGRVNRLKSRHAHREYPWSRTRRLITNVRCQRSLVPDRLLRGRIPLRAAAQGRHLQDPLPAGDPGSGRAPRSRCGEHHPLAQRGGRRRWERLRR